MADYLAPWKFRFRGKTARILAIVNSFLDEPNKGLAAVQLARSSGLSIHDTAKLLDTVPELFVKLPRRTDGITRYRLASSVAARGREDIDALVQSHARRESWIFYALVLMAVLLLLLAALAIAPSFF